MLLCLDFRWHQVLYYSLYFSYLLLQKCDTQGPCRMLSLLLPLLPNKMSLRKICAPVTVTKRGFLSTSLAVDRGKVSLLDFYPVWARCPKLEASGGTPKRFETRKFTMIPTHKHKHLTKSKLLTSLAKELQNIILCWSGVNGDHKDFRISGSL